MRAPVARPPRRAPHRSAAGIAAALATLALGACGPGGAERGAAGRADGAEPPAAAPPAPEEARPVAADVEAACAALAGWWRRDTTASVRLVDRLVPTPLGDTVTGCVVVARQEHGRRGDAVGVSPDSAPASLYAGASLVRGTGGAWTELVRYMADGPDGSSSQFQRGPVRCGVAQSWDGGDDSDPAYVPEDWYEEVTICWWAPEGIVVSDTAP